ncbi:MAG: DUF29 family protein [Microcystis panniformis Mp_MB_F_20051200_S9]|uniref:DUF29 family protein n=1 Tax=Microcystis panniformis Mp_MB_F_20051200_S9 TaxID=2486223 RepID=A0A552PZV9_9CHRO|nr:MAG: DUF29 family protein [Microcystis panniformis Mp_MB_F_20080800_S26D]TRV48312.1 MAG: DUF29 family protein [Microcystis panniformis Mp_GB_SS_20050300_S99]TRV55187.1 MAG: DUF29 family protein [Microcystis panniformis Mp_GB_SS_20050300_S99D]TRV58848.1 MAG: DUF29 family protein [Microcystis panniformis Mp_MB_F_20051200_S9D]TRV60656.1 MAG: DUF29 family protein [Microcystis panniformis Mp_MB_F_20080800_S26]TRV62502.1 MAG: DUF29 family protein [Microcystis panniformis Mp_MB_F_20051200_S9]TRV7
MEELLELKALLLKGDIKGSLAIVEDLEDMSKNGIISTIRSYAVILLLHLIKQQAENRTTRSWDVSIRNSVREIQRQNKRRKAAGYYLSDEELTETLNDAYLNALDAASLEVEAACYQSDQIEAIIDKNKLISDAFLFIKNVST